MRAILVATVVLLAALAGCSGKKGGDDHLHVTCADGSEIDEEDFEGVLDENATKEDIEDFLKTKCPKGNGTGTNSGTNTSRAPNVPPILKMNITNDGGNATNVTMLNGNLTFDATGSSDPDGSISAIAISVQDSNRTRTLPLYDLATKSFKSATFRFDRAGPVNVSIAMIDDQGGFTNNATKVFVNHPQQIGGDNLQAPAPTNSGNDSPTHPCTGATFPTEGTVGGDIADATYFKTSSFLVFAGATFIEAAPGNNNRITICDPAYEPISDPVKADVPVTSNNEGPLTTPVGTESYKIGFYGKAANTVSSALVIVHYEPRPAAPAA